MTHPLKSGQHPLTEEICDALWDEHGRLVLQYYLLYEEVRLTCRAAADWQLEQVIKWLYDNLYWVEEDGSIRYLDQFCSLSGARVSIDKHGIINDLKQALRPQEES